MTIQNFIQALAVSAALVLCTGVQAADGTFATRSFHKGTDCTVCHATGKPSQPPQAKECLACHGDMDKLVASTSSLPMNPHTSPHWGTDAPCGFCHKEHGDKSINVCAYCHPKIDKTMP